MCIFQRNRHIEATGHGDRRWFGVIVLNFLGAQEFDAVPGEFFNFVNSNGYLTHTIGNDVAWLLQNCTGKIGAYYTKTGEVTHPEVKLKDKIDEANGDIHFEVRYYSNPELAKK